MKPCGRIVTGPLRRAAAGTEYRQFPRVHTTGESQHTGVRAAKVSVIPRLIPGLISGLTLGFIPGFTDCDGENRCVANARRNVVDPLDQPVTMDTRF